MKTPQFHAGQIVGMQETSLMAEYRDAIEVSDKRYARIGRLERENSALRAALQFALSDLNTELDYECRIILEAALKGAK